MKRFSVQYKHGEKWPGDERFAASVAETFETYGQAFARACVITVCDPFSRNGNARIIEVEILR